LFNDRWRPLTRADPSAGSRVAQLPPAPRPARTAAGKPPSRPAGDRSALSRHSSGLDQFFSQIQDKPGLNILDLSGASQANIAFITSLGHRLYSEDLLQSLDLAFGDGDFFDNQAAPERALAFLDQNLNFPENHFDGVLAWDVFEYFTPSLLKAAVERLARALKPRSYLFAMFHAEERVELIPTYHYRIADASTLLLTFRGMRRPAQFFNNRAVEKLFESSESVKFFLTRDALREVIVKR
jgi:hypothetical protein